MKQENIEKRLFDQARNSPTEITESQVLNFIEELPMVSPPPKSFFKFNLNSILMSSIIISFMVGLFLVFNPSKPIEESSTSISLNNSVIKTETQKKTQNEIVLNLDSNDQKNTIISEPKKQTNTLQKVIKFPENKITTSASTPEISVKKLVEKQKESKKEINSQKALSNKTKSTEIISKNNIPAFTKPLEIKRQKSKLDLDAEGVLQFIMNDFFVRKQLVGMDTIDIPEYTEDILSPSQITYDSLIKIKKFHIVSNGLFSNQLNLSFVGKEVQIINDLNKNMGQEGEPIIFKKFVQKKKKTYAEFDFKDKNLSITVKQKDGQYYFTTLKASLGEGKTHIHINF